MELFNLQNASTLVDIDIYFNPLQPDVAYLYPLKTSENL